MGKRAWWHRVEPPPPSNLGTVQTYYKQYINDLTVSAGSGQQLSIAEANALGKRGIKAKGFDYIDATTFGSTTKTYLVTGPSVTYGGGGNYSVLPSLPNDMGAEAASGDGMHFTIEGEFQGHHFETLVDLLTDSPIDVVVATVLGLGEEDELVSIAVKHADGTVTVRPWHEE